MWNACSAVLKTSLGSPKLTSWIPITIHWRGSRYPRYYIDPVYKHEELDRLYEGGNVAEKAFIPVKAAKTDENPAFYHDAMLNKFINLVMRKGKKKLARDLVEKAFENIKCIQIEKYNKAAADEKIAVECDPLKIFHQAIKNCRPILGLTPVKRGAIVYQVPIPITDNRALFMAMNWLIEATKDKHRKIHFPEKLAWELLDAAKNEGRVVKKKQDLHKQCEANKAFAHYRWG